MKCSRCGARARDIKGMGAHVRRKHPSALKHKAPHHRGSRRESTKSFAEHHTAEIERAVAAYLEFCPACGHNPCRYRR
jgi:DNA-directed RNA polymerase subunit M/transcription elongation factor TFIIS